jgi:hypothetical protein
VFSFLLGDSDGRGGRRCGRKNRREKISGISFDELIVTEYGKYA